MIDGCAGRETKISTINDMAVHANIENEDVLRIRLLLWAHCAPLWLTRDVESLASSLCVCIMAIPNVCVLALCICAQRISVAILLPNATILSTRGQIAIDSRTICGQLLLASSHQDLSYHTEK